MDGQLDFIGLFSELSPYLSAAYFLTMLGVCALIVMENRNPLKSLAWITVLLFLPGLGILIYLIFGRSIKNQRMISRRKRRALMKSDGLVKSSDLSKSISHEARLISTTIKSLTGSTASSGNKVEVFNNGAEKFDSLINDLRGASNYILLQYYILKDDAIGVKIADALKECAGRGVKVRIIYDDLGSMGVKNRFFSEMTQAGIEVYPFFKLNFPHFASRANWRNHRKIVVIDGRIGYIGGMNIADRYIDGGNFNKWRDLHLRIEGPAVGSLHYSFAVDWNFMGRPQIVDTIPEIKSGLQKSTDSVDMQLVAGGPTDRWGNLSYFFLKAISAAKKRIYVQTPYFLPSQALLEALQVAALSRIDVRVMLPRRSDSKLLTYASRSFVQECLRAGVKIYFYNAGMLHSKLLLIDDDITTIGSTNFDFRSFEHNFEANMVVYSHEFNKRVRELFERDAVDSERIVFKSWRNRPLRHKIWESLLRLFSPVL